jgi:hypothetical protein
MEPVSALATHLQPILIIIDDLDALNSSDNDRLHVRDMFSHCSHV